MKETEHHGIYEDLHELVELAGLDDDLFGNDTEKLKRMRAIPDRIVELIRSAAAPEPSNNWTICLNPRAKAMRLLTQLLNTGLYGENISEVAERLIAEALVQKNPFLNPIGDLAR